MSIVGRTSDVCRHLVGLFQGRKTSLPMFPIICEFLFISDYNKSNGYTVGNKIYEIHK